jgi:hypothetical protein
VPTVTVIGAGLAGLAAARQLAIHGVDVEVCEASDGVGGRVRTDVVDGFRLDRGFQLYNPAYPEAARVLDHAALDLHPLTRGLLVSLPGGVAKLADPRAKLGWALSAATRRTGSPRAKAAFARYAWRDSRTPARVLEEREDVPAQVALVRAGIDTNLLERVLRPFFAGVFLEPNLMTSRRFMDLVLTSFVQGSPSLPALGMQAIPEQLHAALPAGVVHVNRPITSLSEITSDITLVATDPPTAAQFVDGLVIPDARQVTTWYHVADRDPTDGLSVLTVDGVNRGPVLNTVVLSNAVPSYAPPGRVLVSTSTLDPTATEEEIRTHLALLYGTSTNGWQLLDRYAIPYALPAMSVPLQVRKPVDLGGGLFIAGDHRDTASIQGAMVSGRRAADAIMDRLGVWHD